MFKRILLSLAAACFLAPAVRPATAPAAEEPAAAPAALPDAGAQRCLDHYLSALAEGDYDRALADVDVRGIRENLLQTRLAVLKARNPDLTEEQLDAVSASIQTRELAPARLNAIIKDMLRNMRPGKDGGWTLKHAAALPSGPATGEAAWFAVVSAPAGDRTIDIPVPLRKAGDRWYVALDLLESIGQGRHPEAARQPIPDIEAPAPVRDLVDAFWTLWHQDTPEASWQLFDEDYRKATPLDAYLLQTSGLIRRIGIPARWTIKHCRPLPDGTLALGVTVEGTLSASETILLVRERDDVWTIANAAFQPPPSLGGPAAAPAPAALPEEAPGMPETESTIPALTPIR